MDDAVAHAAPGSFAAPTQESSFYVLPGRGVFDRMVIEPAAPGEPKGIFDMLAQALKLAERTEALALQNVELAQETKELLLEVKDELRDVKDELREVKDELREVKEERAG